jgi:hypothetical protein
MQCTVHGAASLEHRLSRGGMQRQAGGSGNHLPEGGSAHLNADLLVDPTARSVDIIDIDTHGRDPMGKEPQDAMQPAFNQLTDVEVGLLVSNVIPPIDVHPDLLWDWQMLPAWGIAESVPVGDKWV